MRGLKFGYPKYWLFFISLCSSPQFLCVNLTKFTMIEHTSISVDESIRTRLHSLQGSFFQALQCGTESLAAFCQEMTGFNEAVSRCEPELEDETCFLIYSFAQTSNAVIPGLIDIGTTVDKMNQELNQDIIRVLRELSLDDTAYSGLFPFILDITPFSTSIYSRTRNIPSLHPTRIYLALE